MLVESGANTVLSLLLGFYLSLVGKISYQILIIGNPIVENKYSKQNFATWSDCYSELIRPTENLSLDLGMVEDELEDDTHAEGEHLEEWMVAAAMTPNSRILEDTDLGYREIDLIHNWEQGLLDHPSIHEKKEFINTLRQTVQETHSVSGSDTSLIALSRQQQVALDPVLESFRSQTTIWLIISGGAGTGKYEKTRVPKYTSI
ncbi:hypothetical protein MKW98_023313 [Papaver atlanticum]|uniref:Uncharacterized protein n=1 Tax=Papaver atlanticum TaxID=357466 RepID=A0AAD4TCF7_9MAGN|nr:hypothetical protein MKW98_023313 [Papaver atlanticum]